MNKEKVKEIAELTRRLITVLGEDLTRPGLIDTPERVARSYLFLTEGYRQDLNAIVKDALYEEKCDEMVLVKNIHFFSLCEHHLLPIWGVCHIGYLPAGRIIGISKIPRIVDMFARRLQLQERMTYQIAEALQSVLNPKGVGVVTEAYHLCMMMRGVQKQESRTLASAMLGGFRTREQTRLEFLSLIEQNKQL
ncbi:GTP cyclohydrolase I FolE [Candidatus Sumerlaeota bacterium]|nr:GTP cyclohydrolase I FolE [Candidatus Sumerlaeota bacterium]